MDWFWSIVGAICVILLVVSLIFGLMFEGTGLWDAFVEKRFCKHKWVYREDLSTYNTKVAVCEKCGK